MDYISIVLACIFFAGGFAIISVSRSANKGFKNEIEEAKKKSLFTKIFIHVLDIIGAVLLLLAMAVAFHTVPMPG